MNPMMRRVANQDFSFAWSLIHEMGAVASGNASLQAPSVNSMWSMPPVSLTDRERRHNATTILTTICESPILEPYLKPLLSTKYVAARDNLNHLFLLMHDILFDVSNTLSLFHVGILIVTEHNCTL